MDDHTLTKQDVDALRYATRYVFRFTGDTATVECLKEITPRQVKGFEAATMERTEVRHEIPVESHSRVKACFVSLFMTGAMQAARYIARPGDRLILRCSDNQNGYLKAAEIRAESMDEPRYHAGGYRELHHDCCWLSIVRGKRTIVRDLMVEDTIAPNNLGRAIQAA